MYEKRGRKTPDFFELLEDIMLAFEHLQDLRKYYRAALPELEWINFSGIMHAWKID